MDSEPTNQALIDIIIVRRMIVVIVRIITSIIIMVVKVSASQAHGHLVWHGLSSRLVDEPEEGDNVWPLGPDSHGLLQVGMLGSIPPLAGRSR
jgi:hypothetical protein